MSDAVFGWIAAVFLVGMVGLIFVLRGGLSRGAGTRPPGFASSPSSDPIVFNGVSGEGSGHCSPGDSGGSCDAGGGGDGGGT